MADDLVACHDFIVTVLIILVSRITWTWPCRGGYWSITADDWDMTVVVVGASQLMTWT